MDQLMKRDRAAFQDLVYDHFKNVEEETKKLEEEAKKLEDRNSDLTKAVELKNWRVSELERQLEESEREISRLASAAEQNKQCVSLVGMSDKPC